MPSIFAGYEWSYPIVQPTANGVCLYGSATTSILGCPASNLFRYLLERLR